MLVPEPDGNVSEQSEDDDEYRGDVEQNEYRKSEDRVGGSGGWAKMFVGLIGMPPLRWV